MKILVLLIISIIIGVSTSSRQCDEKCKSGFPYSSCNGVLNVYRGIGYDGNGNVLFAGKYNSSDSNVGPYGLPAIFSVSSTGGFGLTEKFKIQGEILEGPGYTALDYFYTYLPSIQRYYVRFNQRGSPIFSIYNQTTNTIQPVFNIFNTPFVPAFNEKENYFVYGGYGIYYLDKLPENRSDAQQAVLLYQSQIINGLAVDMNATNGTDDLYMLTYQGDFLKGSTSCRNCTKDKLEFILHDDLNPNDFNSITGFVLTRDYMYYSTSTGIKGYPKNGDKSRFRQLVSENVVSMTTNGGNGDFIYYTTDSGVVKSVSTTGNHPQTIVLYVPTSNGQCQCAVGFETSDGNCTNECKDGLILWSSNGLPTCTKLNELGKPNVCYAAYQCGNQPFSICNGTCTCFPGFSGKDCQFCDGEIIWNSGFPSCSTRQQ